MRDIQVIQTEEGDPLHGQGVYLVIESETSAPKRIRAQLFVSHKEERDAFDKTWFWGYQRKRVTDMYYQATQRKEN